MNIPINRWTVGAVLVTAAIFGPDFVQAILRAVAALGGPMFPAI